MRRTSEAIWRAMASVVGLDEVVLLAGISLIAVGFWEFWRPGAFLVPGALLVWVALPSRKGFIDRPLPPAQRRQR